MDKYTLIFLLCLILPCVSIAAPVASRTSGVAPLSVHFNADVAASTSESRPFHDYEYSWNFGDTASGIWGTDGISKNIGKGPVSSHVYESPGTYTATLTVRNLSGVVNTESFTITVSDPDAVFSGTNTTCISDVSSNDFTGCPSGASQLTTDDLSILPTYTTSGKRVLLRRGSSWTAATPIYPVYPNASTTVHVGAFGTCQSPDSQGICTNAPQVTVTGDSPFIQLYKSYDWRVTDISFVGVKNIDGAIVSGGMDIRRLLVHKVKSRGFKNPLGWTHWMQNATQQITENSIVSNDIQGVGEYCFFGGSDKLSVMGNNFHNSDTTHVVRIWWAHLGVISHNAISGSSLTNSNGRHALKLHGNNEEKIGEYAADRGDWLPAQTRFVVVSDNIVGSSGPWPVSIGPADSGQLCNIQDVIIERNKMIAGYGQSSATPVQIGLMFEGRYITVRNNVIDGTGGASGYTGISVARRGIEWTPLGNRVYNNTIYSSSNHSNGAVGLVVDSSANDTVARNNLVSFPNVSTKIAMDDLSGVAVSDNNLLTNSPGFRDPNNVDPLIKNFSLTSESAAIDQGATVPILEDHIGKVRSAPYDIGAYEYRRLFRNVRLHTEVEP